MPADKPEKENTSVEKQQDQPQEQPQPQPQAQALPQGAGQRQQQRVQVQIDDSKASSTYANFCRVTGTPEELIIDFGLNPQPVGIPTQPISINQRIITNYYTAKRMLQALQLTIQRHEATFGVLETDIQKRVRPGLVTTRGQQGQQQSQQPAQNG